MSKCAPEVFGADPVNIKWNVVRGDTAILSVQFLEDNEKTFLDTSDWDFSATAYNASTGLTDTLDVNPASGAVEIVAPAFITEGWGDGPGGQVASLRFDLQVITDGDFTWTPVIGTISVIGDVTGGNL
jgi:hypothetical protein